MDRNELRELFQKTADGELTPDEAVMKLRLKPFEELGYSRPDHHRGLRTGIPEVIYGAGKTPPQIAGIADALLNGGQKTVIITRLSSENAQRLSELIEIQYHEDARIAIAGKLPEPDTDGIILIATGGTSDIPVAEEAAVTAEACGNRVKRLYDVGVAGIHRLLAHADDIMKARAIVAVAGMEGALASVIGGLADCPVIAVPTSVGYGASFGGVAALLSMLNSCASGVSVVNIDNGFGAGYLASMINHIGTN